MPSAYTGPTLGSYAPMSTRAAWSSLPASSRRARAPQGQGCWSPWKQEPVRLGSSVVTPREAGWAHSEGRDVTPHLHQP